MTLLDVRIADSTDIWFGSRRVARLTRKPKTNCGAVTALYAHRDGRSVLKDEARGLGKLRFLCGAVIATGRGSILLQWRGFGA